MRHQPVSASRLQVRPHRAAPTAGRRRRFAVIAVVLSVGIHLAAALLVVLLPRVLPREARPQEQGTVELLMVEKKGAEASQAGQPQKDAPLPPRKADTPGDENRKAEAASTPLKTPPVPQNSAPGDEPTAAPKERAQAVAADAGAQSAERQTQSQPTPPRSQQAPVFDLAGTDSESDAIALGSHIVPAMKDDRFRNRPPIYPAQAQTLGQNGTVVVVIHVSESGLATGADVVASSGFDTLDRAAVAAVLKWHFHPAMKEGRSVPFDMPFRFVFEPY